MPGRGSGGGPPLPTTAISTAATAASIRAASPSRMRPARRLRRRPAPAGRTTEVMGRPSWLRSEAEGQEPQPLTARRLGTRVHMTGEHLPAVLERVDVHKRMRLLGDDRLVDVQLT